MSVIQRVQDILLRPKSTWPVIAAEPADTATIYSTYLVFVAAIPAIAAFLGLALFGAGGIGPVVRISTGAAIVNMVVSYVLSLVLVYLIALLVDALAPTFGATKNPIAALKVVAYGSTAGFVGGIFNLVPALAILGLVAALYSVYLIYLGLPVLMHCPPTKAAAYTAVVVVCGLIAMVLLAAVTSLIVPTPVARIAMAAAAGPGPAGTTLALSVAPAPVIATFAH